MSTDERSNGRATKRYGVAVSAPTGQIWTVFPLNGGTEVLSRRDRHLLTGATIEQLDEAVSGDLVAEPCAPRAQDAPLAVQPDEG